jgi:hypothetical protein
MSVVTLVMKLLSDPDLVGPSSPMIDQQQMCRL